MGGGELLFLVEDHPHGGLWARALSTEEIVVTAADRDELVKVIREVVDFQFAARSDERPAYIRLHWVREEVFDL